ncbi:MAG: DUF5119 domain-containing protein [Bacteroidales bacterium]|jgi:hypothetical protein|nr:DUF5119 domain-containing protein [Bacteroidales bacterium]MCI2121995.1 DUF5119 domain-containing protein [Bacteroidales bacterium]MCI2145580.1 DUF5119 domain-containing protein [Bacteroidales bacterium]
MKKMNLHVFGVVATMVIAAGVSSSCIHKTLCYDSRHLTKVVVNIDWANAPESPSGSHVAFYDANDPTTFYYFDMEANGGEVEVPKGNYNVICFNNDSETILYRDESSFDTYEAYTRTTSLQETSFGAGASLPRSSADEDQDVVLCPTDFYRDMDDNVKLLENQVNYVYFQPDSAILTYTYEVINIENINLATKCGAAISGIAGSMFLGSGELGTTKNVLPLDATISGDKVTGSFTLFGHDTGSSNKNYFTLYIWSPGGNFYATFDVTDQMDSYPDQKHVHLIIDASGIYIPEPISEGGGIEPGVNDWEDVNEDIIM